MADGILAEIRASKKPFYVYVLSKPDGTVNRSAENRARRSEMMKKFYQDHPERREQIASRQRARFSDPAMRAKMSELKKKQYENPELRQKLSKAKLEYYKRKSQESGHA